MVALLLLACGTGSAVPGNPLASIEKLARISFDATVVERVPAGGYSYLLLDDGRWVVGLDHGHQPGEPVSVLPIGVAHDFVSARTGRTFDTLVFGVLGRPDLPLVAGTEP